MFEVGGLPPTHLTRCDSRCSTGKRGHRKDSATRQERGKIGFGLQKSPGATALTQAKDKVGTSSTSGAESPGRTHRRPRGSRVDGGP